MWRARDRLEALGAEVLLVSFEPLERVRHVMAGEPYAWPVLKDETRAAYGAYGLARAGFVHTWLMPRSVGYYLRAALRGRPLRRPVADVRQLGGDFVIDSQGIVRFAHAGTEPADRPVVRELLDVVERVAAGGGSP